MASKITSVAKSVTLPEEEKVKVPAQAAQAAQKTTAAKSTGATRVSMNPKSPESPYEVDYTDKRFKDVAADEKVATQEVADAYDSMIGSADSFYQGQIDATKEWGEKQAQIQQENTDFLVEQQEQAKSKAYADYQKEQKAAYADYQKQSAKHGVAAEEMAAMGMTGSGYSESAMTAMYTAYQNRVSTARATYDAAVLNYDNNIKEAMLQNNAALAEIAYNTLQQELAIGLENMQYNNELLLAKMNEQQEVDDRYYSRWLDVQNQIQQENTLKEQARQYDESMAFEQKKFEEDTRQFDAQLAQDDRQYQDTLGLQYAQMQQDEDQFRQSLDEEKRQFDITAEQKGSKSSGSSKNSGGGLKDTGSSDTKAVTSDGTPTATKQAAEQYGTFKNGYQPKGVVGHGKLSAYKVSGTTQKVVVNGQTQKIWQAEDGTLWYWDGKAKEYARYTLYSKHH